MKYYLIYKNKNFLGYTTDKKLLDNFINHRKGKYKIHKVPEDEIPDDIKKSFHFTNFELIEYINYYTINDTVLFNYEAIDMEDMILKDSLYLQQLSEFIIDNIKYFKLKKENEKLIKYSLKYLIDTLDCITDSNEVIFDEIINIKKYFYERYLVNRKDIKDIIPNSFKYPY